MDTKREFTDAEVEWAATCLCEVRHGNGGPMDMDVCRAWWLNLGRHALSHGYVPPPRPVPIKEQVLAALQDVYAKAPFGYSITPMLADALLAKFRIEPKE